jgi:hypothetical protein
MEQTSPTMIKRLLLTKCSMTFKVNAVQCNRRSYAIVLMLDRCASTKCRDGESCILNKDGDAECACTSQCEDPKDERLMVRNNMTCD